MLGFLTKPATVFSIDVALRAALSALPVLAVASVRAAIEGMDVLDEITLDSLAELDARASEPFLRRLIERFLESLPEQVAQLTAEHAEGARAQVAATAHGLTGAASAVGAKHLADAARRMYDAPSAQHMAEIVAIQAVTTTALTAWSARLAAAQTG